MRPENQISYELREMVDGELAAGEKVEWMGMPIPRYFTPAATAGCLFGIPWTAFAIFWTVGAAWGTSRTSGPILFNMFPLFGVPFILIGFGLLSGPIWAYLKALKTVYVITNRRAITFEGGKTTTVRSYDPDRLGDIYRRQKKDGTGDVLISRRVWRDSDGDRQSEELGFLRIREPKSVEMMLKKLGSSGG